MAAWPKTVRPGKNAQGKDGCPGPSRKNNFLVGDGHAHSSAPRAREVGPTTTPGTAGDERLEQLSARRICAFRSSGMIGIVVRTRCAVSRLDVQKVVVGAEGRVNGGAPLPVHGNARRLAGECPRPGHWVGPTCKWGRQLIGQTGEQNLVAPRDGNSGYPCVGSRVEGRRSAGGTRRESDLGIGDH